MFCHQSCSHFKSFLLSCLRNTHISKFVDIRLLRAPVSRPQIEKMRITYACDAGAASRSSASGASSGYEECRLDQKFQNWSALASNKNK